jgi:hypothetical protein
MGMTVERGPGMADRSGKRKLQTEEENSKKGSRCGRGIQFDGSGGRNNSKDDNRGKSAEAEKASLRREEHEPSRSSEERDAVAVRGSLQDGSGQES